MAVLLYSNGITENYQPKNLVFSENELVDIFNEFKEIKTTRLIDILNTWCIYGNSPNFDPIDYNRIASDISGDIIYSHVLFVHDSELNPDWKATDSIIYKGYDDFEESLKKSIDEVAVNIIEELKNSEEFNEKQTYLPALQTIGPTIDKRVLFSFSPDEQTTEFYLNDEFYKFAQKVYSYIKEHKQDEEPFTIYADKKAIIIVDSPYVKPFLSSILEKFQSKEEYEVCTDITNIMEKWNSKKIKNKGNSSEI